MSWSRTVEVEAVNTAAFARQGGASGPAVVPGKSADSLLIQSVRGEDGLTRMPYKQPALTAEQVRVLTAWIDQGARAPAGQKPGARALLALERFEQPRRPRQLHRPGLSPVRRVACGAERWHIYSRATARPAWTTSA